MSRESASVKGRRYICEGRLTIDYVSNGKVLASCKGDGESYRLGFDGWRWFCSCPAKTPECSHLVGLRLVTTRRTRP